MQPILVGYTNLTGESDADEPARRARVELTDGDFVTHIHGIGATRSGKSKWLEWFCRQLIRDGVGFTLVDPQGELAESLIQYCAYYVPSQPVIYYDPSRTDYLIPFNPWRTRYMSYDEEVRRVVLSVLVSKFIKTILRVWGVERADDTPRLERWLRSLGHLLVEGIITINEVSHVLSWDQTAIRQYAAEQLTTPSIQNEWFELLDTKRITDFNQQIESVRNRMTRLTEPLQIRRIMSTEDRNLDFRSVFHEGAIVIANLRETDYFSGEHGRLIGTTMINELWGAARRDGGSTHDPYFLFVDEVERFVTPDLSDILVRGAGKGIHLGVFHQHLSQLYKQDELLYDALMQGAKTKLVFGGLTDENAITMVKNMFMHQIAYDEVKLLIEQTKFWPKYMRDKVYMTARGGGRGSGIGAGMGAGQSWNPYLEEMVPSETMTDTTIDTTTATWSDGSADIPIFYPEAFREISSTTPYTLEEHWTRLSHQLMEQYQRHYFIKRHGQKTIPAVTPFVGEYRIFPENEQVAILEDFIKPYALPISDIDRQLDERLALLIERAQGHPASSDAQPEPEEELNFRQRIT